MIAIKRLALIGLFALAFFSCNDNDCSNTILNPTSLEQLYDCVNTEYLLDLEISNSFKIIRTQSIYDNLVTGSCQPQIDFNIYDLVIGKQVLTSGNSSITYELTRNCKNINLDLKVIFNQNITSIVPNLTYHALIPKLGDEQTVNVQIEIKY